MFSSSLRKQSHRPAENGKLNPVVLVRGHDMDGNSTWFYLMVDAGKLKAFKSNQGKELVSLTDYGRVLYSGFGKNPSDIIKWKMEKEYGFTE